MSKPPFPLLAVPLALTAAGAAHAGELALSVEIPTLAVAEYHRPYVAMWIENADQSVAANLAVWYDTKKRDGEGSKWLKDLRQWWRRAGRDMDFPVDGLTSATRAPGSHTVTMNTDTGPLAALKPGTHQVVIEAAREVGGRELVRVPLHWPPEAEAVATAAGTAELGTITLTTKP
jgi:hypothetical protein